MKNFILACLAIFSMACIYVSCKSVLNEKPRVLVFSKTAGFHHNSIPTGIHAIQTLGQQHGFDVDTTTDGAYFQDDSLKNYAAIIFLNSTGDILRGNQQVALQRYVQAGGGIVGVHAASDAAYDWPWYGKMIGAYFDSHPSIQEAVLNVQDKTHPATSGLPDHWKRTDEWYNFKKISPDIKVLISIDEKSYTGGKNGANHPMSWYHDYDGGRVFYTEFGHTDESYADSLYLQHLLGGIEYAIANNPGRNYAKSQSTYAPDEDRFIKTQLVQGTFFEPTELTILPNLDVLISQRRGEILFYKNSTKSVKQVGFIPVYWKAHVPNVNAEEGLLGIKVDPDFDKNHWVYIFYSPSDTSVNRLSRLTFENDTLDLKSEKVILQYYSQREICCHTGGSIAFGPDKSLFVSCGDNTTPFNEPKARFVSNGYAPLNDIPGHLQYDEGRGSGNTNDLRGKILRIKPNADGTYSIPEGNLFPKGTPKTRPEIYVMGDRNPYRISVDPKNGYLYWGEVGPDANEDSLDTRGPRGYDEANQARKAGFFGWPYFIGNNYPYRRFDYATGKSGETFDPAKPVNESRNNTGLRELPPAQPAFIWYPYAVSPDFPSLGSGGRCAMAGPVYYSDLYPQETRYPSYYDGKFFFYDWIRGFFMPVTMTPEGDYQRMEPFMEHTKFNSVIDMEVGPDGRFYMLEYGSGWFQKNPDAGLVRIDYNGGNRAPKISSFQIDKETGDLPFVINAKVQARDPEKEPLTYSWDFGDGQKVETTAPEVSHTFTKTGDYGITVTVKDAQGAVVKSDLKAVYAGNVQPEVKVTVEGNQTFYFPGKKVGYKVLVNDPDDSSASRDLAGLFVSATYDRESTDKAGAPLGHQQGALSIVGKSLMMSYDCKTCHKVDEKSIGPAYTLVAAKYSKDPRAAEYLMNKIRKGGGGVWGETVMAAHPSISESDLSTLVQWILSLNQNKPKEPSLAPSGTLASTLGKAYEDKSALVISASYTDKGGAGGKPLTGTGSTILRSNNMGFDRVVRMKGYEGDNDNGIHYMVAPKGEGWFSIDQIDLSGVKGAELSLGFEKMPKFGYVFEFHLDGEQGALIGTAELNPASTNAKPMSLVVLPVKGFVPVTDGKFHDIYVISRPKDEKESEQIGLARLKWIAP